MINAVALHHKVQIKYEAARKAKKAYLGDYLSQQAARFGLLPGYGDAILLPDLPLPWCRPWVLSALPLSLAMDRTFTKVLIAVSVDAGNHVVLLAWVIAESESEQSWRFFLLNLLLAAPAVNSPDKYHQWPRQRPFYCG